MIKTYFFDLMGTLAKVDNMSPLEDLISQEQHNFLLKHDLTNLNSPKENKGEIERRLYSSNIKLYPDSEIIIETLKDEGYKLGIISNIYSISKEKVENHFSNFLNNFDILVWSCEVGLAKPDRRIFMYTLDKLNKDFNLKIVPEEVIMIGDNYKDDIFPAKEIGMQTKLINRTKQSLYEII
jgi:HAD superfamily hydrolase (TIGR01549 family)